jgi:3-methyladenine DNA glycosylase/8-oxoguanine DNA glycosylase
VWGDGESGSRNRSRQGTTQVVDSNHVRISEGSRFRRQGRGSLWQLSMAVSGLRYKTSPEKVTDECRHTGILEPGLAPIRTCLGGAMDSGNPQGRSKDRGLQQACSQSKLSKHIHRALHASRTPLCCSSNSVTNDQTLTRSLAHLCWATALSFICSQQIHRAHARSCLS